MNSGESSAPDASLKNLGETTVDPAAFLADFLAADTEASSTVLLGEIEELLGRKPTSATPKTKRRETGLSGRKVHIGTGNSDSQTFDWYVGLLQQIPRFEEEAITESARRVEVGLLAGARMQDLVPETTSRREIADLYRLIEEGNQAWRWLILVNLRLVFHWSKGIARSVDSDWAQDAFQVGCLGLMRGLEGWDYQLGYKLSTFVSWHIRQAIQRWRANDVLIIRIPVHVWETLDRDGSEPTDSIRVAVDRSLELLSVDAMVERREDAAWDGGLEYLEDRIDRERAVHNILIGLDHRSLDIIQRRFGLKVDLPDPETLDQIGEAWGVSRERIRQLEKKTLDSLRARAIRETWT